MSYNKGMMSFKDQGLPGDPQIICLIDNDCFLESAGVLDNYVQDFEDGKFDWAAHHVGAREYGDHYCFDDSSIAVCPKQEFVMDPSGPWPHFAPHPHWENSFLLIRRSIWNQLNKYHLSHSRIWIMAVHNKGAKMGAHKASYRWNYTHFGEGWFHVGNLMRFYKKIEANQRFNQESNIEMSRLGYFLAWAELYPERTPSLLTRYLNELEDEVKDKARSGWQELIADTCMENWEVSR
jgi:hypothetical protein